MPPRTCLSLSLTLEFHNRATYMNTLLTRVTSSAQAFLWQSTLVQVYSVNAICINFVWTWCVLCMQVCPVGRWVVLGLCLFLVRWMLFFGADVHSGFLPAFKAVPRGQKMNWHCFTTSFHKSHWEWVSASVCPGVIRETVKLKSFKWFVFSYIWALTESVLYWVY